MTTSGTRALKSPASYATPPAAQRFLCLELVSHPQISLNCTRRTDYTESPVFSSALLPSMMVMSDKFHWNRPNRWLSQSGRRFCTKHG